jgi:hypothetical protein
MSFAVPMNQGFHFPNRIQLCLLCSFIIKIPDVQAGQEDVFFSLIINSSPGSTSKFMGIIYLTHENKWL